MSLNFAVFVVAFHSSQLGSGPAAAVGACADEVLENRALRPKGRAMIHRRMHVLRAKKWREYPPKREHSRR
jgi:hypothetical protein